MENIKEKIENSKMIKERIDTWISNCDSKVSFLLTFLGVIATIIFTSEIGKKMFQTLSFSGNKMHCENHFLQYLEFIFFLLFIVLVMRSFYFSYNSLIARINPDIYNEIGLTTKSNLFFKTIAEKDFQTYHSDLKNLGDEELLYDLNSQIFISSKIATEKFRNYNKSLENTMYSLICFILFLLADSL